MKTISDNIKAILALIVVVTGVSYFYMCSIRNIKPDPQILIAYVGSVTMCLGYYFGASSKSGNEPISTVQNADTVNVKK